MREKERERESEKEGKMTWMFVGAEIMTWRCLEEKKKFLSASSFNLYYRYRYRYIDRKMCSLIFVIY